MDWFLYDRVLRHERVKTMDGLFFSAKKNDVLVTDVSLYIIYTKLNSHSHRKQASLYVHFKLIKPHLVLFVADFTPQQRHTAHSTN